MADIQFYHINKKANFEKLANKDTQHKDDIIFIKDSAEIWNDGVYYGSGSKGMTSITYKELVDLRNADKLVPGMYYRITDYTCTTTLDDTRSAGHVFDIITLALSTNVLSELCLAIQHEGDSNFSQNKLSAWLIWYDLDNDATKYIWADPVNGKGVIYRMIDEFNNDCPYDFKNIQFRRYLITGFNSSYTFITEWDRMMDSAAPTDGMYDACFGMLLDHTYKIDIKTYKWRYTFDSHGEDATNLKSLSQTFAYNGNAVPHDNIIKANPIELDSDNDTFNAYSLNNIVFLIYSYSDSMYNVYANYFDTGCYDITLSKKCHNNNISSKCTNIKFGENCFGNTLGANCMNITFGEDCWHNILGDSCYSNIFDRKTQYTQLGSFCGNNEFGAESTDNKFGDLCCDNKIGWECINNHFGSGCASNIIAVSDNNKFGDYCSQNEFEQSCLNILDTSCYGNQIVNSNRNKLSIDVKSSAIRSAENNTIGTQSMNITIGESNNNIIGKNCEDIEIFGRCQCNIIENACHGITIANRCFGNVIKTMSYTIEIGTGCSNNIFGTETNNIFYGDSCSNNILGSLCSDIYFAGSCNENEISNSCRQIDFGNICNGNKILSTNHNIMFGNFCIFNTIEAGCAEITFGNYFIDNTILKNCGYFNITNNPAPSMSADVPAYKNITVLSGTNALDVGHSLNLKSVLDTNANYPQYVGLDPKGELVCYVPTAQLQVLTL